MAIARALSLDFSPSDRIVFLASPSASYITGTAACTSNAGLL